jgi:hypothetical protein
VEDQGRGRRWEELREDEVIFFELVDFSYVIFEGEFGGIWVPFDRVVLMDC